MKRILILLLPFTGFVYSQDAGSKSWGQIGLTYFGLGSVGTSSFYSSEGGANYYYENGSFNGLGITYLKAIDEKRRWTIDASLEYVRYSLDASYKSSYRPGTTSLSAGSHFNISVLAIPVTFRLNFLKYFFFNPGFVGSVDLSETASSKPDNNGRWLDKQNGLGLCLGLGYQHDFSLGFSVFASIHGRSYNIFDPGKRSVLTGGLRLGVLYDLGRFF